MKGFTTSQDRICLATGEESAIDWESLPQDVAQALLDKIAKGKSEEDIEIPEATNAPANAIFTAFGHAFTLQETLQASCLMMQIVALIVTIIIACKIHK